MSRLTPFLLLALSATFAGHAVLAAEQTGTPKPPPAPKNNWPAILKPREKPPERGPTKATAPGPRLMPKHVSEVVRDKVPKFSPKPESDPDEIDDPDVIKMPPVLVEMPPEKVPSAGEIKSDSALSTALRRRFPGASVAGQDPRHIENGLVNYGAFMASGEAKAQRLEELTSLIGGAVNKRLRGQLNGGTYRENNSLFRAMEKSATAGRY